VLAVQSKTLLKGALHLAVMANVTGSNPVRDVSPIPSKSGPKGAPALSAGELRELFGKLRTSEYCQRKCRRSRRTPHPANATRPYHPGVTPALGP
jgi:hypothetical protein